MAIGQGENRIKTSEWPVHGSLGWSRSRQNRAGRSWMLYDQPNSGYLWSQASSHRATWAAPGTIDRQESPIVYTNLKKPLPVLYAERVTRHTQPNKLLAGLSLLTSVTPNIFSFANESGEFVTKLDLLHYRATACWSMFWDDKQVALPKVNRPLGITAPKRLHTEVQSERPPWALSFSELLILMKCVGNILEKKGESSWIALLELWTHVSPTQKTSIPNEYTDC